MLARIRKAMEEKEEGFTLIELLVVMIIIGILAAIAIPVFLSQRQKGYDASVKSDLRTIANELESYNTDQQAYPADTGGVTIGNRRHDDRYRPDHDSHLERQLVQLRVEHRRRHRCGRLGVLPRRRQNTKGTHVLGVRLQPGWPPAGQHVCGPDGALPACSFATTAF